MDDKKILNRRICFIGYAICGFLIFITNNMTALWISIPVWCFIFLIIHIKLNSVIKMHVVLFISYFYLYLRVHFLNSPDIFLYILALLSLSIAFQRISAVYVSSIYSFFAGGLALLSYKDKIVFVSLRVSFAESFAFSIIFMSCFLCYQTYIYQKLQKKSETETINAKKGRKKVTLLLNQIKDSAQSVSEFSSVLNENVSDLKKHSENITKGFKEMTDSFVLQNSNLNVIDSNIIHINENIQDLTESFQTMFNGLKESSNGTEEGYKKLQRLETEILSVDDTVSNLSNTMKELNEQSNQILAILEFISNISKQTNILALNAHIEAARSGENGKGFAVIASEVKSLSEKSNQSAIGIAKIVENIIKQTQHAVEKTGNSEKTVIHSKQALEELNQTFDVILKQTNDTAQFSDKLKLLVENVSESSHEIVKQIIALSNKNGKNTEEIQNLLFIIEKQNEHIHEISNEFLKLESHLDGLNKEG